MANIWRDSDDGLGFVHPSGASVRRGLSDARRWIGRTVEGLVTGGFEQGFPSLGEAQRFALSGSVVDAVHGGEATDLQAQERVSEHLRELLALAQRFAEDLQIERNVVAHERDVLRGEVDNQVRARNQAESELQRVRHEQEAERLVLASITEILWPAADPEAQWEVDTIEHVAAAMSAYDPRRTLTYAAVKAELQAAGISIRKVDVEGGEYRLNYRMRENEGQAYYTDDLVDALRAGRAMAEAVRS